MELGLKGKRAIITGASKGIGKAIALTMGGEGANLAVCARGSNSLKETVKDLESKGITVYPHTCDVVGILLAANLVVMRYLTNIKV